MMELKNALYDKFNTIITCFYGSAPEDASLPYAVFNTRSGRFADYRDDIDVTVNIYDDKKEKLSIIEDFALEFQKLDNDCVQTDNGAFILRQINRNDLDFEIEQNRRREITFNAKWYNANFFSE